MLVYADSADLAAYTGVAAPANATQLLRFASMLVRRVTSQAFYAVDETGLPTDADVLTAFRDATCAQANAWSLNGIDPAAGVAGVGGVVVKKSLGSASVDYAVDSSVAAEQARLAGGGLTLEAMLILRNYGLLANNVVSDYPYNIDFAELIGDL